ncbi:glycosyltransferase [Thermoleptolyngbya sichuanensis A183]|uniref:Glycosyltransferase n=1 Tax=Thermoleptolyngbya sichuanensis A183 TaxID=2737172 RepID=A0A6M8BAX0_9CYAN|nr:glycosyltransferase [Thermoleptolyngbya sichuanensis]QKD84214.1 glycosyltransferase [Thermoleptolyngbya sichuanensis A183]
MKIAYLMNQHPYASCTFIRREILELETQGIDVTRFSIRKPELALTDAADQQEFQKTRFILGSKFDLLLNAVRGVMSRPQRFLAALRLALKTGWKSDRGLLVNLVYLAEACGLLRGCIEMGIDHVHAHFGTNATAVAMLCHALGGPSYSFTVHGPHEFDKPEAIALSEKIRHAAFVVAISSFTESQLFRWCDYPQWSKIHIIHCGVDDLFLLQPSVPLPQESRFVCVGRLGEQKGHLLLLEAVSQLAAEGLRFKVVLVGDGPLRAQIEQRIKALNLHDYLEITGWATNAEVQQQILAAQVMVLPSFAEGLPVVLMESLALGRPVLSTYIAGIPELVEPGVCGWLVPSGSVTTLAAAMRQVLQTPLADLERMGQAGAARVAQFHSARVEAARLAALFQRYVTHPGLADMADSVQERDSKERDSGAIALPRNLEKVPSQISSQISS